MSAAEGPAPRRFARRGIVVMGIVVLALLAFGSTTRTWLSVRLPQDAVQMPDLAIAGSDAATPVTAFALVALAAALAVSIAGRVARWIIAVILVLSGVGIALSSASVALDPAGAAEPAIGTAIGVSGLTGAEASATGMPWLAVVAGILLAFAAAWVVLAGRTWGVNRRYDAGASRVGRTPGGGLRPGAPVPSTGDVAPGAVSDDAARTAGPGVSTPPTPPTPPTPSVPTAERDAGRDDSSDSSGSAVSDGSGSGAEDAPPVPATGPVEAPGSARTPTGRTSSHADEIDSWDELSRGNDPTR